MTALTSLYMTSKDISQNCCSCWGACDWCFSVLLVNLPSDLYTFFLIVVFVVDVSTMSFVSSSIFKLLSVLFVSIISLIAR